MKKFNSIKNLFKLLYYQINPRFEVQVEQRQMVLWSTSIKIMIFTIKFILIINQLKTIYYVKSSK